MKRPYLGKALDVAAFSHAGSSRLPSIAGGVSIRNGVNSRSESAAKADTAQRVRAIGARIEGWRNLFKVGGKFIARVLAMPPPGGVGATPGKRVWSVLGACPIRQESSERKIESHPQTLFEV